MEVGEDQTKEGADEHKVTVTKYLNVRVGSASVNAPCYQYLSPGTELVVKKSIEKGDSYDGDDRWLKDAAGNYYWVGGTNHDDIVGSHEEDTNNYENNQTGSNPSSDDNNAINTEFKFPWIKTLHDNLPGGLPKGDGEGVVVAILDSGTTANTHDLEVIGGASFLNGSIPANYRIAPNDSAANKHGTAMAAIIKQLCNSVQILSLQVAEDEASVSDTGFQNALDEIIKAYENEDHPMREIGLPKIINLSISCSSDNDLISVFNKKYDDLKSQGVQVIAAAGNSAQLKRNLFRSARSKDTLRVGTFTSTSLQYILDANVERPEICFSNNEVDVAIENQLIGKYKGCSPYTAICSGLIARGYRAGQLLNSRITYNTEDSTPISAFQPYHIPKHEN